MNKRDRGAEVLKMINELIASNKELLKQNEKLVQIIDSYEDMMKEQSKHLEDTKEGVDKLNALIINLRLKQKYDS